MPPPATHDGELTITQDDCLLMLPRNDVVIEAPQTLLVMVKLGHNLSVSPYQTSLELAIGENTTVDLVEAEKTRLDSFPKPAQPTATISLTSSQAAITPYRH